MNDIKNSLAINDGAFYTEICILKIDRISMLCIIGDLELALRHPDIPANCKAETRKIGRSIALRLIREGIILPEDVMESWRKTFGITYNCDDIVQDKNKGKAPVAEFLGMQEDLPGRPLVPMYNIIGGKLHGSTVSATTLRSEGIKVPEPAGKNI